jgi:3-dehydroshikimate dehydratase
MPGALARQLTHLEGAPAFMYNVYPMIRIGLSSTALLTRDYREVLRIAREAGLDALEWAGDMHVPHDDAAAAASIMMETLRAGLTIASFAPLYRAGASGETGLRFDAVLQAASILQAPIVRVYVGGAREAGGGGEETRPLAESLRRLGDKAAVKGITLCLSLGRNTWMDRYSAARAIVAEIGHPFVRLAWEPLPGLLPPAASAALDDLGGSVAMLIARRLDRDGQPERLPDEADQWRRRLAAFKRSEADPKMARFVVIGAVRDAARSGDVLPSLAEDLQFLKGLVAEAEGASAGK